MVPGPPPHSLTGRGFQVSPFPNWKGVPGVPTTGNLTGLGPQYTNGQPPPLEDGPSAPHVPSTVLEGRCEVECVYSVLSDSKEVKAELTKACDHTHFHCGPSSPHHHHCHHSIPVLSSLLPHFPLFLLAPPQRFNRPPASPRGPHPNPETPPPHKPVSPSTKQGSGKEGRPTKKNFDGCSHPSSKTKKPSTKTVLFE